MGERPGDSTSLGTDEGKYSFRQVDDDQRAEIRKARFASALHQYEG